MSKLDNKIMAVTIYADGDIDVDRFSPSGKSRRYKNSTPATRKRLQELGYSKNHNVSFRFSSLKGEGLGLVTIWNHGAR